MRNICMKLTDRYLKQTIYKCLIKLTFSSIQKDIKTRETNKDLVDTLHHLAIALPCVTPVTMEWFCDEVNILQVYCHISPICSLTH